MEDCEICGRGVSVELDSAVGPRVMWRGEGELDQEEIEWEIPVGWTVDWETPSVRTDSGGWSAPLVVADWRVTRVSASEHGVTGWDVTLESEEHQVEVTLVRRGYDGRPSRWGSIDNWVDWRTVTALSDQPEGARQSVLDELEHTAALAVLASDVDPGAVQ